MTLIEFSFTVWGFGFSFSWNDPPGTASKVVDISWWNQRGDHVYSWSSAFGYDKF